MLIEIGHLLAILIVMKKHHNKTNSKQAKLDGGGGVLFLGVGGFKKGLCFFFYG